MAFSVPKDAAGAFVKFRARHDALALASGGIVSLVTFESEAEADELTFLSLIRVNDPAAYRAFLESPHTGASLGRADNVGSLLVTECYEIVEELRGS